MDNKCTCTGRVLIQGENAPKLSSHLYGCPMLKKHLFYYEEAVDAWIPAFERVEQILDHTQFEDDEIIEIEFRVVYMSDEEFNKLTDD